MKFDRLSKTFIYMRTFMTGLDKYEYLPDLQYTPTTSAHECICLLGESTKQSKTGKCVACFGSGYVFRDPTSKTYEAEYSPRSLNLFDDFNDLGDFNNFLDMQIFEC